MVTQWLTSLSCVVYCDTRRLVNNPDPPESHIYVFPVALPLSSGLIYYNKHRKNLQDKQWCVKEIVLDVKSHGWGTVNKAVDLLLTWERESILRVGRDTGEGRYPSCRQVGVRLGVVKSVWDWEFPHTTHNMVGTCWECEKFDSIDLFLKFIPICLVKQIYSIPVSPWVRPVSESRLVRSVYK